MVVPASNVGAQVRNRIGVSASQERDGLQQIHRLWSAGDVYLA